MQITKELLDIEVAAAEKQLATAQHQYSVVEGGLSALRQMRALLDKEMVEEEQNHSTKG